jgi:hypothetical protein
VRYVQTIGGTSPSFTRTINRLQSNGIPQAAISQLIDRSINITISGSVSPSLNVQNAKNIQVAVNMQSAVTAPRFMLEASVDNGVTWYDFSAINAVANQTFEVTSFGYNTQLIRARVTQAGATATLGYLLMKGY